MKHLEFSLVRVMDGIGCDRTAERDVTEAIMKQWKDCSQTAVPLYVYYRERLPACVSG